MRVPSTGFLVPGLALVGVSLAVGSPARADREAVARKAEQDGRGAGAGQDAGASQASRADERQLTEDAERAIDLLRFYEPNYFLSGFSVDTPVKFQVSFKYMLWATRSPNSVYLGYTQLSRWKVWDFAGSSPFVENNYQPELFYEHAEPPERGCGMALYRAGVRHTSNGERGESSRGMNRVFGELGGQCWFSDLVNGFVELEAWYPFGISDNPDIADFIGYGALSLGMAAPLGTSSLGRVSLSARMRKGASSELERGSVNGTFRWAPPYSERLSRAWRFLPDFYAQLFAGYAETLNQFDRSQLVFRVGIAISDRFALVEQEPAD